MSTAKFVKWLQLQVMRPFLSDSSLQPSLVQLPCPPMMSINQTCSVVVIEQISKWLYL